MTLSNILLLMMTTILVENYVFSQFLGICPFLGVSGKRESAVGMGFAVIFVMTLSGAAAYLIYRYILVPFDLEYLKTIVFVFVIAALVQIIEMFLHKFMPSMYEALGIYLPLITTNCAVLGSALLVVKRGYESVFYAMLYSFSAGLGFLLALVIFAGVRERIRLADVPRSFSGVPIALIAAGLVAMAFSGFSGMRFTF